MHKENLGIYFFTVKQILKSCNRKTTRSFIIKSSREIKPRIFHKFGVAFSLSACKDWKKATAVKRNWMHSTIQIHPLLETFQILLSPPPPACPLEDAGFFPQKRIQSLSLIPLTLMTCNRSLESLEPFFWPYISIEKTEKGCIFPLEHAIAIGND